jgi:virginiamycin B lyase
MHRTIALALLVFAALPSGSVHAAGLAGRVSSAREAAMEGVLVTAQRDGATIATTVVSNAQGQYSFPAERLPAGRYQIRVRATGFLLDAPRMRRGWWTFPWPVRRSWT